MKAKLDCRDTYEASVVNRTVANDLVLEAAQSGYLTASCAKLTSGSENDGKQ